MNQKRDAYFYASQVSDLQVLAEEATRARPDSPESRFVTPEGGVLDKTGAKYHHILYGRRGSGKSSLLRHIETDKRTSGHLVAWIDQEVFMGLDYPDVLISTLSSTLVQFSEQIQGHCPQNKLSRWQKFFRRQSTSVHHQLAEELRHASDSLETLKAAPSKTEVEWKSSYSVEASSNRERRRIGNARLKLLAGSLSSEDSEKASQISGSGISQKFTATKASHLEKAIPAYRELIRRATKAFPDAFIILDDFYRLAEVDQPRIAGYLHRVVKDTSSWLKIGSIEYWTHLYSGDKSVGIQESHDARRISLDRGLLDFENSKRFLERILASLAAEVEVDVERLLSRGARDRLVLAAGGVPRDYIGLLGEAITVARNRGPTEKSGSSRVIAEDVNEAAGRTVEIKFNDLEEDAPDAVAELRSLVIHITNHCRNTASASFLIDSQEKDLVNQMKRLQNMRFVHAIDTNESLPDPGSSRYDVFMLDVSQLVAQRAWQVDFMGWTKREKRRSRKLVFRRGETDQEPAVNSVILDEPRQLNLLDQAAIVDEIDPPVGDADAKP